MRVTANGHPVGAEDDPAIHVAVCAGTLRDSIETGAPLLDHPGLEGRCQQQLGRSGTATFSSLKFQFTSWNCDKRPFHLIVGVFAPATHPLAVAARAGQGGQAPAEQGGVQWRQAGEYDGSPPPEHEMVALACVRSPPIVVDARKRTNRERPRANEYDVCLAKRKGAVGSIGGGGGGAGAGGGGAGGGGATSVSAEAALRSHAFASSLLAGRQGMSPGTPLGAHGYGATAMHPTLAAALSHPQLAGTHGAHHAAAPQQMAAHMLALQQGGGGGPPVQGTAIPGQGMAAPPAWWWDGVARVMPADGAGAQSEVAAAAAAAAEAAAATMTATTAIASEARARAGAEAAEAEAAAAAAERRVALEGQAGQMGAAEEGEAAEAAWRDVMGMVDQLATVESRRSILDEQLKKAEREHQTQRSTMESWRQGGAAEWQLKMLPSMEVQVNTREGEIAEMRANKCKLDALCDTIVERQRALAPQRRKLDQARAATVKATAAARAAEQAARATEQAAQAAATAETQSEEAEQLASHELEREQHAIGQADR